MNKFPIIAAIATIAIFTLASCEQTQTPEQMKIAARQERIKTMNKMNKMSHEELMKIPKEERQKMIDIMNKGRDENEPLIEDAKDKKERQKKAKEDVMKWIEKNPEAKRKFDSLRALQ